MFHGIFTKKKHPLIVFGSEKHFIYHKVRKFNRNWKGDDEVKGKTGGVDVEVKFVLDTDDVART